MPEVGEGLAGHLVEGGHLLRQRVYFEDTDFTGLVYHARYLHFMERGRSDYLRLLGIGHRTLAEEGLSFAAVHLEVDFRKPARIDDVVTVRTSLAELRRARLTLAQRIESGGTLLVEAKVTIAMMRADGRPVRLPPAVLAAFAPLSSR
jgi:acyl-CoA thioester hydrolase